MSTMFNPFNFILKSAVRVFSNDFTSCRYSRSTKLNERENNSKGKKKGRKEKTKMTRKDFK